MHKKSDIKGNFTPGSRLATKPLASNQTFPNGAAKKSNQNPIPSHAAQWEKSYLLFHRRPILAVWEDLVAHFFGGHWSALNWRENIDFMFWAVSYRKNVGHYLSVGAFESLFYVG